MHAIQRFGVSVLVCAMAAVSGCGSDAGLRSGTAGKTVSHTPGAPDFDMESAASWRNGNTGVDLYLKVPYSSLVFLRSGNSYIAIFEFNVRATERHDNNATFEDFWTDSVRIDDPTLIPRTQSAILKRDIVVPPGDYLIEVQLQDRSTDIHARREQRIIVRGVHAACPMLSRIFVERKEKDAYEPVLQLYLPGDPDSFRTTVTLFNPAAVAGSPATMTLLKLRSDTSVAAPPFLYSPHQGSLRYAGLDFDTPETLQTVRTVLQSTAEETTLSCPLPVLWPGMYVFTAQVSAGNCPDAEPSVRERRYIPVMGRGFPRPTTLDQLIEALVYIARGDELKRILSAESVAETRRRFDSLWIAMAGGQQAAANTIRQYYTRVEEANQLFTSFKEGWKTDRGMVYIVFGPPESIEPQFLREIWRYPSGYRFDFVKAQGAREEIPFENYILQRDSFYETFWNREVERWRHGKSF